jgi:hypothetical protein
MANPRTLGRSAKRWMTCVISRYRVPARPVGAEPGSSRALRESRYFPRRRTDALARHREIGSPRLKLIRNACHCVRPPRSCPDGFGSWTLVVSKRVGYVPVNPFATSRLQGDRSVAEMRSALSLVEDPMVRSLWIGARYSRSCLFWCLCLGFCNRGNDQIFQRLGQPYGRPIAVMQPSLVAGVNHSIE